jgi:hypothetical protein
MPTPTMVSTDEILALHKKGLSCREISQWYNKNISELGVYKRIYKQGLKPNTKRSRFNDKFFETIRTEKQAYWLGFIFADGCVLQTKYKNKNINALRIGLCTKDLDHLQLFLKDINSHHSVCLSKRDNSCRVSLESTKLISDLIKLGCVPRKTNKLSDLPLIPRRLIRHFIRGYFDGDGYVGIQGKNIRISIVGTEQFLIAIRNFLIEEGVYFTEPRPTSTKVFVLAGNGNIKGKLFFNLLYKKTSRYLSRKRRRFDAIL